MTRSTLSPYHPRIAKKTFRANAKQEGMTFRAAAEARTKKLMEQKFPSPNGIVRRNPGRSDGLTWQGSAFICSRKIDGPLDDCDSDNTDYDDSRPRTPDFRVSPLRRDALVIHSLLDIARLAKPRGPAKAFEMIQRVRDVIMLDDDHMCGNVSEVGYEPWSEDDLEDEDDWEELYGDERAKPKTCGGFEGEMMSRKAEVC